MPTTAKEKSRGRKAGAERRQPDYPYILKLRDGRRLFVEIPGRWVTTDRDGEVAFLPPAVELLDRIQVLATPASDRPPTPGYIATLRKALGLTQERLGQRLGVDKMTISRWERGTVKPSRESVVALDHLRKQSVRKGVTLAV